MNSEGFRRETRSFYVSLQEYDLEIQLAKIVRWKGLCKLVAQVVNSQNDQVECDIERKFEEDQIYFTLATTDPSYGDIKFLLIHGALLRNLNP